MSQEKETEPSEAVVEIEDKESSVEPEPNVSAACYFPFSAETRFLSSFVFFSWQLHC